MANLLSLRTCLVRGAIRGKYLCTFPKSLSPLARLDCTLLKAQTQLATVADLMDVLRAAFRPDRSQHSHSTQDTSPRILKVVLPTASARRALPRPTLLCAITFQPRRGAHTLIHEDCQVDIGRVANVTEYANPIGLRTSPRPTIRCAHYLRDYVSAESVQFAYSVTVSSLHACATCSDPSVGQDFLSLSVLTISESFRDAFLKL